MPPARPAGDSGTVNEHHDVIIIGSGAGGGTLAHTLAGSGKSIMLLERGDFLPRETQNWDPRPVFVDGRYISKDTWFDGDGKPFQPQVHYFVGGATKLYGAALPLVGRGNVTLVTGAEVTRLETDAAGRAVTGVVVSRDGEREVYTGDVVVVSAGAANSAKLLLNSATDKHPTGLANGSDQVG